jgi:hypothetical protein
VIRYFKVVKITSHLFQEIKTIKTYTFLFLGTFFQTDDISGAAEPRGHAVRAAAAVAQFKQCGGSILLYMQIIHFESRALFILIENENCFECKIPLRNVIKVSNYIKKKERKMRPKSLTSCHYFL